METEGYVDGVRICTINPEAKIGKRGKTGIRGITYKSKRDAYVVSIGLKGKMICIGRYDGPIEKTNCVNQTIAMPLI